MSGLLMVGNKKLRRYGGLHWHGIRTKSDENRTTSSKVIRKNGGGNKKLVFFVSFLDEC
jgi:hypothetical protein